MANKNEAEGALQRVLEELVTEFRGFSRIFSSFRAGAGGGGSGSTGSTGGIGALAGGALGVAGSIAGFAVNTAAKVGEKVAKETGFRFLTNRVRFSDQESARDSFGEAAFRALSSVPVVGGGFSRAQGTIDRATQRTKAIVGDIARASGKVDEERTAELSDFLLDRFKGEETAAQKAGEIVDRQARPVFQSTREEAYASKEGAALAIGVELILLNDSIRGLAQVFGLRD